MNILLNIIKQSQTLSNIYLQQQEIRTESVPTPSTSGIQTRWHSAIETQGMKYKCKKCDHTPFQMKYGLAKHVSVKH